VAAEALVDDADVLRDLLFGFLLILGQSSALAPFIYTIF